LSTDRETFDPVATPLDPALPLGGALAAPVPAERGRVGRLAWELLHDLSVAVLFCFFVVTFVAQPFRVQGTSMQPLLADGERIVVNKFVYRFHPIEYGDVVVFWWPRDPAVSFIKRVGGKPGDLVEIRAGQLYVNRRPVQEAYLAEQFRDHDDVAAHEVAPGYYYVLGDHRNGSNDSRAWGEVPEKYIYGRAAFRFWPLSRFGSI
jgi:signal peptidase I